MAKNMNTLIKENGLESKEGYYSLVLEQYGSDHNNLIRMFNDMKKDNKAELLNVYMEETVVFKDIVPEVRKIFIEEILEV